MVRGRELLSWGAKSRIKNQMHAITVLASIRDEVGATVFLVAAGSYCMPDVAAYTAELLQQLITHKVTAMVLCNESAQS